MFHFEFDGVCHLCMGYVPKLCRVRSARPVQFLESLLTDQIISLIRQRFLFDSHSLALERWSWMLLGSMHTHTHTHTHRMRSPHH